MNNMRRACSAKQGNKTKERMALESQGSRTLSNPLRTTSAAGRGTRGRSSWPITEPTHRVHVLDVLEGDEQRYGDHHIQRQEIA